jgi:hypothetical protein
MEVQLSKRKGKRLVAIFKNGKKVHFGSEGQTYVDHKDKEKRAAYLARHGASGKQRWDDPYSAGALSRWILWGDYTSMEGNIAAFRRRFNL